MNDERIRQLTQEVLSQIEGPSASPEVLSLETRVEALEATVAHLQQAPGVAARPGIPSAETVVHVHAHPSLHLLNVPGGTDHCLLEPDKPCVNSGCCRTLGH